MAMTHVEPIALYAASFAFGLLGFVNLYGSKHVQAVYRLWHFPHHWFRVIGLVELMVVILLVMPQTRIWGIFGGGMLAFATVATLLYQRQYLWSLLAILLLVSLVPASLARP